MRHKENINRVCNFISFQQDSKITYGAELKLVVKNRTYNNLSNLKADLTSVKTNH